MTQENSTHSSDIEELTALIREYLDKCTQNGYYVPSSAVRAVDEMTEQGALEPTVDRTMAIGVMATVMGSFPPER